MLLADSAEMFARSNGHLLRFEAVDISYRSGFGPGRSRANVLGWWSGVSHPEIESRAWVELLG
jgi:hypothetical protein